MTRHARKRAQSRGIGLQAVETIIEFGRELHDHRGCCIYFFDRKHRERLRKAIGEQRYRRVETRLNAYVVVAGDGAVITTGHRYRRIWVMH